MSKLLFDTLHYAKLLAKEGVNHADSHACSLAQVLGENIYSKGEIDMSLEKIISRFDKMLDDFRLSHKEDLKEMRQEFQKEMRTSQKEAREEWQRAWQE